MQQEKKKKDQKKQKGKKKDGSKKSKRPSWQASNPRKDHFKVCIHIFTNISAIPHIVLKALCFLLSKETTGQSLKMAAALVIFGDGLKNKDHVKFKGLRWGASDKLCRQLKLRKKLGELLLLGISKYNTSKVSINYIHAHTIEILI
jgi:hypothetical protein